MDPTCCYASSSSTMQICKINSQARRPRRCPRGTGAGSNAVIGGSIVKADHGAQWPLPWRGARRPTVPLVLTG
jgi:hypothetical protein